MNVVDFEILVFYLIYFLFISPTLLFSLFLFISITFPLFLPGPPYSPLGLWYRCFSYNLQIFCLNIQLIFSLIRECVHFSISIALYQVLNMLEQNSPSCLLTNSCGSLWLLTSCSCLCSLLTALGSFEATNTSSYSSYLFIFY